VENPSLSLETILSPGHDASVVGQLGDEEKCCRTLRKKISPFPRCKINPHTNIFKKCK
jgi:hypothetical protein